MARFSLPPALREISGLAYAGGSTLLAVTDEVATVYGIDLETEGVKTLYSLGDPVIRGDFEGIAIVANDVWLVTSKGMLYRVIDGLAQHPKPNFEVYSTHLKKRCEVEGLATDGKELLLACKTNYRKKERDQLMIYRWSATSEQAEVYLNVPLSELGPIHRLEPSGLSIQGDTLHIVAAGQKTRLDIDRSGKLLHIETLAGHPQAEGIEVLPDGSFVIADEGKNGAARLSRYKPTKKSDA